MKQTLQNITIHISEIKKQYQHEGFEIVGIFGSYAQGKADRYSDVDIIAYKMNYEMFNQKFKGGFVKIFRIEEIKEELQKLLHIKVDLVPLDTNNTKFENEINKDIVYV